MAQYSPRNNYSMTREQIKHKIATLGLRPSRANGQNFLIDDGALQTIVSAAKISPGETVLEIGPGLGVLTEALLAAGAHVTAVEFDPKIAAHLESHPRQNLTVIAGDILRVATPQFLSTLGTYKLVANIPYHITSDIIRHFTENEFPPTEIVLLMQKEVAERVMAQPPHTNQLAFFTQWFAKPTYVATVPAAAFEPAPEVNSAILHLAVGAGTRDASLSKEEEKKLFSLVKRGYSNPRKQLRNNVSVTNEQAQQIDFDFSRRAETVSAKEWITLQKILAA